MVLLYCWRALLLCKFLPLVHCNRLKCCVLWVAASRSGLKRNFGAEMPERVGSTLSLMGCRFQVPSWFSWDFWYAGTLGVRRKQWVNKGKNCRNPWMIEWVLWKDLGIWVMLLKHCLGITCGRWRGGQRCNWASKEGLTKETPVLLRLFCYKMGWDILHVWGCWECWSRLLWWCILWTSLEIRP